MSSLRPFVLRRPALSAAILVALAAGGVVAAYHTPSAAARAAEAGPPATPVGVRTLALRDVRIWSDFSGRLRAVDAADVRPEVSGRITEVRFADGQIVKAGDVLFVIDPRPYQAAVAKATADLASARANEALAKLELDRAARLLHDQWVAQSTYDQRVSARDVAQANVAAAAAALQQAQLDVDHAYVKASISGRVSRAEITTGNLVQAGVNAPLLASVVSNDGIYADFEVDEETYLRSIHTNGETSGQEQKIAVELTSRGDTDHVYRGQIESFDNKIDSGSGTIRARARFDNTDGSLVPGMFVSVRLAAGEQKQALLVPERAIENDQDKKFVYVVGADNKAAFREVHLGEGVAGQRIVAAGLKAGDRVIVDGIQKVQPNAPVEVHETTADNSTASQQIAN